jgi:hypothetical protein
MLKNSWELVQHTAASVLGWGGGRTKGCEFCGGCHQGNETEEGLPSAYHIDEMKKNTEILTETDMSQGRVWECVSMT